MFTLKVKRFEDGDLTHFLLSQVVEIVKIKDIALHLTNKKLLSLWNCILVSYIYLKKKNH